MIPHQQKYQLQLNLTPHHLKWRECWHFVNDFLFQNRLSAKFKVYGRSIDDIYGLFFARYYNLINKIPRQSHSHIASIFSLLIITLQPALMIRFPFAKYAFLSTTVSFNIYLNTWWKLKVVNFIKWFYKHLVMLNIEQL